MEPGGARSFHNLRSASPYPSQIMKTTPPTKRPRGFSLVELLVTIGVLGVLSALALASMSNITGEAAVTTAKSQAQRIVSTFGAGMATGAPGFVAATGVDSAMDAVGTGSAGAGSMRNVFFQLGGVFGGMDDDKPLDEQAKHYLSWSNGTLVYAPEGGGTSGGNQYDTYEQWVAALTAAMTTFAESHPGANEQDYHDFYQSWIAANPEPDRPTSGQLQ